MKMIRSTLLATMLLLAFGTTWGQNVGGGLTVAGLASQIDGDQWGGYNKAGYMLGGYAYYDFSDFLALQVEILHTHRGSREVNDGYGQINLNFIDIPVLLRLHLLDNGNTQIYGEAGPSISTLLSAKNGFKPLILDQTDLYRRFVGEFNVGGSIYFTENIGMFARWSISYTNLWRASRPWLTIHYFSLGARLNFK